MKVKFCGIRREEDVQFINMLPPDYMGMILSAGFRRTISMKAAKKLLLQKSELVQAVGVFVDETVETILSAVELLHLDVIQLHGTESPELVMQLQEKTKLPVWKAVRVRNKRDLQAVAALQADQVILEGDTKDAVGGTGICADWELLSQRTWNKPFFLAGGLKPENIMEAISVVHPTGLDLSSGIEIDGVKSFEKMKQVITMIQGAKNDGTCG